MVAEVRHARCPVVVLAITLGFAAVSHTALADTTPSATVSSVWQYSSRLLSGNAFVYLDGVSCDVPNSDSTYFIIPSADPKQSTLVSLALAAQLAKKPVKIEFDPATCNLLALSLE